MDLDRIITTFIIGGLVLLSFLKLTNVIGVNKRANRYFGVFAFLWSTFWLDELLLHSDWGLDNMGVRIFRFIQFLVPIPFYISILNYTDPYFKFSARHLKIWILPALFFILLLLKARIQADLFGVLYIFLFLFHALLYTVLAYLNILKHQKNIEEFSSNKENIDLKWIKYIIYSFIASAVIIIIYNVLNPASSLNIYINTFFLIVVYLVAYYSIRQKEIYPREFSSANPEHEKMIIEEIRDESRGKLMSEDEISIYKSRLLHIMETDQPYLDSELNLVKLSAFVGISGHQLSYVINKGFDENFYQFVNKYRVKKAEELLRNPAYDHLNMLAIGFEAGFNSKTSFNTTFKKLTALTPTGYRNNRVREDEML
ncbi:MAG: helix-turn-helix domain-containing protein [Taibaiella sp.]|nr:helix-turn-helix domain-containing protein [Taibaiella sp.]